MLVRSTVLFFIVFLIPFHALGQATRIHASWYGPGFQKKAMANGELFDMEDQTIVAHKSLPLGTRLRVTNPKTDVSLEVVVKDRGPYIRGRDLDFSRKGAEILGFLKEGVAPLLVEEIKDHW